jgi:hypothetical protein
VIDGLQNALTFKKETGEMQDRPIGEDATTTSPQISNPPRYTLFRQLDTLFTRGEVALQMARNFSQCGLRELASGVVDGLANFNKVSAMDLYGRTPGQAVALLQERFKEGVQVVQVTPVSGAEACIKNLRQMQWSIERGMRIELLTEHDLVVGVKTAEPQIG